MKATVKIAGSIYTGYGSKLVDRAEGYSGDDIESAETRAVGRALRNAGFVSPYDDGEDTPDSGFPPQQIPTPNSYAPMSAEQIIANVIDGRWLGSVGNAELGEYVLFDDRFIDDREEFKERYYDYNDDELCEKFGYEPGVNEFSLKNGYCTQKQYDENKENEKHLEAYLDEVAERAFVASIIVNIDLPEDIEVFEEGVSIDE